jgi:hypothetical protein
VYIPRKDAFEIDLGYSVYYGYFLESYDGGRYAIVGPTIDLFAPKMADIRDVLISDGTKGPFQ